MRLAPARVVSGRLAPELELVEVLVATIDVKCTDKLLKALAVEMPMHGLTHLKRIRRDGSASKVDVILCRPGQHNTSTEPPYVHQCPVLSQGPAILAEVRVVSVPATVPHNREQCNQWARIWPINWRVPEGRHEIDLAPVSAEEQAYFERHMSSLLAASHAAGGVNLALVVDPSSAKVIAEGRDGTDRHPLAHTAMEAVAAVARRDLRLWPSNPFVHLGRSDAEGSSSGSEAPSSTSSLPHKRQRHNSDGGGAGDAAAAMDAAAAAGAAAGTAIAAGPAADGSPGSIASATAAAAAADDTADGATGSVYGRAPMAASLCSSSTAELADLDNSSSGSGGEDGGCNAANKPYLCTGWDFFVVREPCLMCSMALVHSRLKRIIYCKRNPQHGALGGRHRLHAQRSLNHHYQVYWMPLEGEDVLQQGGQQQQRQRQQPQLHKQQHPQQQKQVPDPGQRQAVPVG